MSNKLKSDVYQLLYDKNIDYEFIYHFINTHFGNEKVDILLKILGRDFVNWSISDKRENMEKLFELNYIISDYSTKLESSTDPIILGMTVVGKFRDILLEL